MDASSDALWNLVFDPLARLVNFIHGPSKGQNRERYLARIHCVDQISCLPRYAYQIVLHNFDSSSLYARA